MVPTPTAVLDAGRSGRDRGHCPWRSRRPQAAAASADGGGTAPTEAACALVTKDDVATAAGFSIANVTGGGGTCFFQNADPGQYLSSPVVHRPGRHGDLARLESSGLHIDGLGDDAFWRGTRG